MDKPLGTHLSEKDIMRKACPCHAHDDWAEKSLVISYIYTAAIVRKRISSALLPVAGGFPSQRVSYTYL